MLQNVRDNMKGTIATIVVILFVVPMVVTGIGGSSFLSSIAGTEAATVNKRNISRVELSRAVFQQKERMIGQGVDPTSDQLKDENLAPMVLQSLIQRVALATTAEKGGMGIADTKIYSEIQKIPAYQTEGKFDRELYRQQLSNLGFTPTTFKNYVGDIMLIQQQSDALAGSSFVTDKELEAIVAIAQEKRDFSLIEIPAAGKDADIAVTEEEIQAYYDANQSEFLEPEKMAVEYLELSVDDLMKTITVSEDTIKQRYDEQKADFESTSSDVDVQIAHLMLEKDDNSQATIAEIQTRLQAGEDFAALVKEFSVDEGSKESGGELGVLIKGTFSEEFEAAALALEEGQVSAPVETDSGIHLIKALVREVQAFPSLDEKRLAIETSIKRERAEESYAQMEQDFEDMTFSAGDLQLASESLNLPIKSSSPFERNTGTGIAGNASVREAAWRTEVLMDGRNSPKIQLAPGHAVVVRRKEHIAEHVLPLERVKMSIQTRLKTEKLAARMQAEAEEVLATLKAGADAKSLAEEKGYSFSNFEDAKRFETPMDFQVRNAAFEMPASDGLSYESVAKGNGDQAIIILANVEKGKLEDMPEQQLAIMRSQLKREGANSELLAYQAKTLSESKVKTY